MSRVDEAMRRAAERLTSDDEQDPLALAHEPFPVEMSDQFRPAVDREITLPDIINRPATDKAADAVAAPGRRPERAVWGPSG